MPNIHCIIIGGPTASGKSELALSIPKARIINGDSLQIYQDLQVLTARPAAHLAHHHLYGFAPPTTQMNVMTWRGFVELEIQRAIEQGQTPVIVGGTGFYLTVLIEGLSPIPEICQPTIDYVRQLSLQDLHREAQLLDQRILEKFADRQRIQRAVAVQLDTGKSLFYWQSLPKEKLPYHFETRILRPDRHILCQRIDERFASMIKNGAIEEVRMLKDKYPDILTYPIAHAIGFKEIYAYLQGDMSLASAILLGQQKTRQYAKRQLTFFRGK